MRRTQGSGDEFDVSALMIALRFTPDDGRSLIAAAPDTRQNAAAWVQALRIPPGRTCRSAHRGRRPSPVWRLALREHPEQCESE